ncbi:LysR family transcriptional regulator [Fundicoccus sp. Sow4_H7]|uniref:LysR family transcriptional regulator n=1 Tax=Fundicoccus sp. Sow4_H7 TaxID=3438784 RepID=UPI003F91B840
MELNLHHLRIFYTVAKEKTTYNAAKALRISQPSVSSQVKQFEETIGISLFQKKGRNIVLTEFGILLFNYAKDLFSVEKDIIFEINEYKETLTLQIAGHQLAIEKLLNPMIKKFKTTQRTTDVNISIKSTNESIELLKNDKIDLAIIGLNPNLDFELNEVKYSKVHLLNDRFCFVVRSNFDTSTDISKNELTDLTFVGRLENSYSQSLLDRLLKNNLQFELRFENASSALEYTLSNDVVYFSSYALVREYIEQSLLKEIQIFDNHDFSLSHQIYAIYKKKNKTNKLIQQFLNLTV